jgi:hypothetical protein
VLVLDTNKTRNGRLEAAEMLFLGAISGYRYTEDTRGTTSLHEFENLRL